MIAYAALHARHASLSAEQQEVESRRGLGRCATVGGAPYPDGPLQKRRWQIAGIMPVYAFSTRESGRGPSRTVASAKAAVWWRKGFVPAL
jgi:hypothetical protein